MKEGWGITNFVQGGGKQNFGLYVSDGTSKIQVVDGDTYSTLRTITVRDEQGKEIQNLNELEFVNGLIWSNIWFSNDIIGINPETGKVEKRYNMKSLRSAEMEYQKSLGRMNMDVLNGIAYDPTDDTFLLTGKKWHLMFKVKLN